ncbi:MAG: phosphate signaling complex protein PhoU [Rhodospirillaceae bacterium]|jgi:phosphate transport system protein|nr:phosphate signaling complex protein PhoU [Rhodospirillaceae bacterium]MBT4690980.1 phosphate signaling complex protein PhoU [Rhodospirillaceae bacterium]MBT5881777.1 phosphate signaling complex protein PhoU [Rhodospirillaceae bacterium]MBT6911971.1 phosphate signaling complex protein PhoU [Rhodospirillaceae bacterium]MBT7287283.1 phosphate signaling complex protein PhoU [Rhodospirillaceae bacterium]
METEHIVKSFDEELLKLDNLVVEMGGLAESQLADAIAALVRRDIELAGRVVEQDKRIDAIENEIHGFVLRLLATRQPVAVDLRIILASLKISSSLERIGDYAKNIAKRTTTIAKVPAMGGTAQSIARMTGVVQGMIKNVLDAYIGRDVDMAADVRARDEEVDQMHTSLFRELLTYMMEDPRNITPATHLLFTAKNVERIGDHVTGIAEQIHFMVAGELPGDLRPKGDNTSYTVVEVASPLNAGSRNDGSPNDRPPNDGSKP